MWTTWRYDETVEYALMYFDKMKDEEYELMQSEKDGKIDAGVMTAVMLKHRL